MKRVLAAACLLVLLLGRSAGIQAQGPARSIIVVAPRNLLTVGEDVQLRALTRDQVGTPRRADPFTWSSNNPAVVSVDPTGVASARGIGTAVIAANAGVLRSTVTLQTFPQRVDILADRYEISVGEELQMAAVAFDIRGEVIPNVPFRWEWAGDNGGQTNTASVSQSGVLRAIAAGAVTVRAVIPYTVPTGMNSSFIAYARVVIRNRQDYRLRRLLASDPLPSPVRLRPVFNGPEFSVNDSGQMAFVGDISGLTNALMRYDNGRFELLASTAMPAPAPGSLISSFQPASINNRGEVLVNFQASGGGGAGSALVVFDKSAAGKPVFFQNTSEGSYQRINFFSTTRYSFNDSGTILFMANFSLPGGQQGHSGLFRLNGTDIQALSTTVEPLPGFPQVQYYGNGRFGIDRNGTAYFVVVNGSQTALYKADGQNTPTRIAGTGDNIGGFVVQSINSLGIAPNGNIAFTASSATFESKAFRFRPADRVPQMVRSDWAHYGPISINDAGDVVFAGSVEGAWGLHRSFGDTATLLLTNSQADSRQLGGTIGNFSDAFITSQGHVYAHALTTDNDSLIVRADTRQVLFRSGQALDISPNLNFLSFVPGAGSGPPQLVTGGGSNRSLHELSGANLVPIFLAGDRMGSDIRGFNLSASTRTRSGTMYYSGYFDGGNAIFRYANGLSERVFQAPIALTNSSPPVSLSWINGDNNLAASDEGTQVFIGSTNTGQSVLISQARGQVRVLAFLGGNSATPSPSGGQFERIDWTKSVAVDEQGRIAAFINVRNGPSGIFLHENGNWRTVSLLQDLRFDGQQVNGVYNLDAASGKLLAAFSLAGFSTVIAEYANGRWTPLISRGQFLPNGVDITFVNGSPVFNRNGDLAVSVFTNAGNAIIVRTTDGNIRIVYSNGQITEAGDLFSPGTPVELDLRDDRRLYVIATSVYDQRVLYLAEPLF